MLIAFATALGAVAFYTGKTAAGSGPYAAVLADELVKSGQHQPQLFQNLKEGVYASTGRRQVPWERNGFARHRVLVPAAPLAAPVEPALAARHAPIGRRQPEAPCMASAHAHAAPTRGIDRT